MMPLLVMNGYHLILSTVTTVREEALLERPEASANSVPMLGTSGTGDIHNENAVPSANNIMDWMPHFMGCVWV